MTLELTLRYIENVHSEKIVFHFDGIDKNKILVEIRANIPPGFTFRLEGFVK